MPARSIGSIKIVEPDDKTFAKFVISDGEGDVTPNDGAVCTINLSLVEPIDIPEEELCGYKLNETTDVTIGEGDTYLSEVFDKVLCTMKEKEASYFKVKVTFDGEKLDEMMGKDKQMKFNIILQSLSRSVDIAELEGDEKLDRAQHHKDRGSELFKAGRLVFALKRYERALAIVQQVTQPTHLPPLLQQQCRTLTSQCHLNIAACHLKNDNYEDVLVACTSALQIDPGNVKGLFRRGQAYTKLDKLEHAQSDFRQLLSIEPTNRAAQNQLTALETSKRNEKEMCEKMFS